MADGGAGVAGVGRAVVIACAGARVAILVAAEKAVAVGVLDDGNGFRDSIQASAATTVTPARRIPAGATNAAGDIAGSGRSKASRAAENSPIEAKRSCGCLANARSSARSTGRGRPGAH